MSGLVIPREGSAKDITREDGGIGFDFVNYISGFDVGRTKQEIPGKGAAICTVAVKSAMIAKWFGIPTAFIKQLTDTKILVREFDVILGRPLTEEDTNCILPVEWITRYLLSGSLLRDLLSGKKKLEDYGFDPTQGVPPEGTILPWPVNHATTKFEETDRELSNEEAMLMCSIDPILQGRIWAMINRYDGIAAALARQLGYAYCDGKKEVALVGPQRIPMLGDVWHTQDEDRFFELAALENEGRIEHQGKEYFRQALIAMGYKDIVDEARRLKQEVPFYPDFSESVLMEGARRYTAFAEAWGSIDLAMVA
ncbi:hypothetical protein KKA15_06405 [Patescibacteria group bacterium]|nr:hypothetical protein [Patescibacteria group bacterium]